MSLETVAPGHASLPAAPAALPALVPTRRGERIEDLDVVRGFALLGIFLMNVEWFTRPISSMREGMPRDLTGADWAASWFVLYFVQGKFWTTFTLLFGMGFALMLGRAQRAGRDFVGLYLRRTLALAVFGAAHYIFLWDGDILFTYAVGALALLVALHGRPWPIVLGVAALAAAGALSGIDRFFVMSGGLGTIGLLALHLRSDVHVHLASVRIPLFAFIVMLGGALTCVAAVVWWIWPDAPPAARLPLTVFGPLAVVAGWLAWRGREPEALRGARLGAGVFVLAALVQIAAGVITHVGPDPTVAPPAASESALPGTVNTPLASAASNAVSASGEAASGGARKDAASDKSARKPTPAERAQAARDERDRRLAQYAVDKSEEARMLRSGTYAEWVLRRGGLFPPKVAGDFALAAVLMGMFLLGGAFVRSGVIDDTAAHRPLFRRLAFVGLPLGIGLGLGGSLIAMSHTPGDRLDGWGIACGLAMLGDLPASLGYVGLVVTLLQARKLAPWMRLLAPMGRMALTNYLLQSLVSVLVFYGFALGRTDMSRARQVVFVLVVFACQLAFSRWWLRRFRFGPAEWLWRGFTYREVPRLRLGQGD